VTNPVAASDPADDAGPMVEEGVPQVPTTGRGRWIPRLAAIVLAGFFVIPLWFGAGLLAASAATSCPEPCGRVGGGVAFVGIAGLGFLLATGAWRRQPFVQALGLLVTMLILTVLIPLDGIIVVNDWTDLEPGETWLLFGATVDLAAAAILLGWSLLRAEQGVSGPLLESEPPLESGSEPP
jgi:hypothetical protein